MNIARGYEPVKGWIDPAIHRNVTGTHVSRFATRFLAFLPFTERAKFRDIRSAVVRAGAENLPTGVPPESAAHDHVRGEVLVPHNPRGAHPSRQAIDQQLCHGPGIFVSDHAGDRPTNGRMSRGKGVPTLEKTSPSVPDKGAIPSRRIFKNC